MYSLESFSRYFILKRVVTQVRVDIILFILHFLCLVSFVLAPVLRPNRKRCPPRRVERKTEEKVVRSVATGFCPRLADETAAGVPRPRLARALEARRKPRAIGPAPNPPVRRFRLGPAACSTTIIVPSETTRSPSQGSPVERTNPLIENHEKIPR